MTTNMQQGTLLDVLKKKMRQTKEEMEKYKDEGEEYQKRLQCEVIRREEVSFISHFSNNKKTHILNLWLAKFYNRLIDSIQKANKCFFFLNLLPF